MMHKLHTLFRRLYGTHRDPARDWIVLLTASLIALASVIVWNAWAFDTIANGGVIGETNTTEKPTLNTAAIDAIRAVFSSRAEEHSKYVTGTYRYTDPSQ